VEMTWFSDYDTISDNDVSDCIIGGNQTLALDKGNNNEGIFLQIKGDYANNNISNGDVPQVLITFKSFNGLHANTFSPMMNTFYNSPWDNQTWINSADGSGAFSSPKISYDSATNTGVRLTSGSDPATENGYNANYNYAISHVLKETDKLKQAWCWGADGPLSLGFIIDVVPLSDLPTGSDGYLYKGFRFEDLGMAGGTEGIFDYTGDGNTNYPDVDAGTGGMFFAMVVNKKQGNLLEDYAEYGLPSIPSEDMYEFVYDGNSVVQTWINVAINPFGSNNSGVWGIQTPYIKFDGNALFSGVADPGQTTTVTETQDIVITSSMFSERWSAGNVMTIQPAMEFWNTLDPELTKDEVMEQYYINGEINFDNKKPYVSVESDNSWVDEATRSIRIMNTITNVAPTLAHVQPNGSAMTVTFDVTETGTFNVILRKATGEYGSPTQIGQVTASAIGGQSITISSTDINNLSLSEGDDYYIQIMNNGDENKWARGYTFSVIENMTGLNISSPTADSQHYQGGTVTVNWNTTSGATTDDSGE